MDKSAVQQIQQAAAIEQAQAAVATAMLARQGAVVLPDDFDLKTIEHLYADRLRLRGTMTTPSLKDFVNYTGKGDRTKCFVNPSDMHVLGVVNFGSEQAPGHADDLAIYKPTITPAYQALLAVNNLGKPQQGTAEWMEDWIDDLEFFHANEKLTKGLAIAAIRNIDIESIKKSNNTVETLSESRSAFDSVTAKSLHQIPTILYANIQAYADLEPRTFVLRVAVLVREDKPQICLRIQKLEQHKQDMADELAAKVRAEMAGQAVFIGTYSK